MKKYITLILAATVATSAFAAKGDSTLDQFLAAQKKQAEAKGWPFDEAKLKKQFAIMDADGNGIVSGDEKKAYWADPAGAKARVAAKPAATTSKSTPKKTHKADQTKAEYLAQEKVKYEKKGWQYSESKVGAIFDAIDANKDGLATGKEKKAYWDSKK
ncbi:MULTISPECIES: hypothetical protein [unclassified Lentimonas]|uniref:hypothetical protein n=1 Tax=unclassified Lentimonas TaxID=2630993 RepID=UPI0013248A3B|nr:MULTISPECIES: hypothetical protein [unclassified Lentimonas]CAA6690728.1 Unannotated [Lentimonas sp. CC19]CAA6693333.1 Unannotated [Lentimonas sp. CC10]CAA7071813.1 Unannotated [Lentimonas sp. CC11]